MPSGGIVFYWCDAFASQNLGHLRRLKKSKASFGFVLVSLVPETGLAPLGPSSQLKNAFWRHYILLVPETGLEPAHQMAYAPKAYVYTNFTTRARFARPR